MNSSTAPAKRRRPPALFATLLRQRGWAWWIVGVAAVQLGTVALGYPGLGCPIREASGIPCPGCGLTTAVGELLRGQWRESLATHAFAAVFLLALVTLLVGSLLPGRMHARLVASLALLEERTGLTEALLVALLAYWAVRVA